MIKRIWVSGLVIFFLLSFIPNLLAQGNPYDKYLTVADIQKVMGLTGVKQVPREPRKGAGGHLNFANHNGEMILIASFLTAEDYNSYKSAEGMVKEPVKGLGDEAFVGPGGNEPAYMLLIRKGDKCLALSTFAKTDDFKETQLNMDQVIAIGKIVIDRM
jgi:hypothetical protein